MKFLIASLLLFCFVATAIAIESENYTFGDYWERRVRRVEEAIARIQERLSKATGAAKERLASRLAYLEDALERVKDKLEPQSPVDDAIEPVLYNTAYDTDSSLQKIDDAIDRLVDRMRNSPLKMILQRKIDRLRRLRELIKDRVGDIADTLDDEDLPALDFDETGNYEKSSLLEEKINGLKEQIKTFKEKIHTLQGSAKTAAQERLALFLHNCVDLLQKLEKKLMAETAAI